MKKYAKQGPILPSMLEEPKERNNGLIAALTMAINVMQANEIPTDILELEVENSK